jgi:hypothetical protein
MTLELVPHLIRRLRQLRQPFDLGLPTITEVLFREHEVTTT